MSVTITTKIETKTKECKKEKENPSAKITVQLDLPDALVSAVDTLANGISGLPSGASLEAAATFDYKADAKGKLDVSLRPLSVDPLKTNLMLSGSDIEIVVKDVVVKQSGCVVPLSIKVTLMVGFLIVFHHIAIFFFLTLIYYGGSNIIFMIFFTFINHFIPALCFFPHQDPTKFELPIAQACGSGSRPCVSDDRTFGVAGTACKTFCSALKAIASEPLFSGTIDIAAQFSTETKDGFLVGDTSKKCEAPPGALSGNSTNGTQLSAGSVNVLNHGVAFAAVSTLVMALFA